jgi:UDP-N-acetylmuramate--alanine ligase
MTDIIKKIPGKNLHMVGVGGIGMSGLAQMLNRLGYNISGSDRGLDLPENHKIVNAMKNQGIQMFPQDGSYIESVKPDALIYSTAIEEDNPDFLAAPETPKIHRAQALANAILAHSGQMIAVSGSCGKTTVTSWLAETMYLMNLSPSFLSGGLVNRFSTPDNAGNYYHGTGNYFIFEADESDKSLVAYEPDYAILLNIGTDHYSKTELIEVFQQFLQRVKKGVVVEESLLDQLGDDVFKNLSVKTFSTEPDSGADWVLTDYTVSEVEISMIANGDLKAKLPAPGKHTAANALSILAMCDLLGLDTQTAFDCLTDFQGVWRRFDYAGQLESGARVYDDYAHNVEKIASCIKASQETSKGKVITIFQPHGYGPLGFMKDELLKTLEQTLDPDDIFILLPVFYAGGTSSFTPKSEEVVKEFRQKGTKKYFFMEDRNLAQQFLEEHSQKGDSVLITGARDNSLSDWASNLTI